MTFTKRHKKSAPGSVAADREGGVNPIGDSEMTSNPIIAESTAERTLLLPGGVQTVHPHSRQDEGGAAAAEVPRPRQGERFVIGAEIHPEVPMPHWATSRYLDDEGRTIADEASTTVDGFDIELSQAHAPDGRELYEETVCLWWMNEWAAGSKDRETCVILPDRIPALIAALQHAQAILAGEVTS